MKINFQSDIDLSNLVTEEKNKCIGCKACMKGCPMLHKFTNNPKNLLTELNSSYTFTDALSYSCMLCGYCTKVCPTDVSLNDLFFKFRKKIVKNNNNTVPKHLGTSGTTLHQTLSFSPLFLDKITGNRLQYVFFPGCSLLSNDPNLVKIIYQYLQIKIPNIGYWNACCGKPSNALGKEKVFIKYLNILQNEYKRQNTSKIIVACENCYMVFKKYCPNIEIISLYDFLYEYGIPEKSINKFKHVTEKVNVHDPCPTRNEDKMHESIRGLLNILGLEVEELKFSKRKTICCGAGGMVPFTARNIAHAHTERRANDGDKIMVTYCRECVARLTRYGRKIVHILDLIFSNDEKKDLDNDFYSKPLSTMKLWKNRFNARSIVKNEK